MIVRLIAVVALLFIGLSATYAQYSWVNDNAFVLSQSEQNTIQQKIISLNKDLRKKPQIVVFTVKSLNGSDIETFSNDLFKKVGIGDKRYDNGLLLLIATEDRKIRIEVGYGLEAIITDAEAARIIKTKMVPVLTKGKENWALSINNAVNEISNILRGNND